MDLDTLVRIKILNWKEIIQSPNIYHYLENDKHKKVAYTSIQPFSPSTNIKDAWVLAERLGLCVIPQSDGDKFRWYACDLKTVSYANGLIVLSPTEHTGNSAETAQMAITLAALNAHGLVLED
jgi:hypothetical protein